MFTARTAATRTTAVLTTATVATAALAATALVATTATSATATTSATAATSATATTPEQPRPVVTRVDIDGDLKPDTVRLARTRVTADEFTFRITVDTAKGKRAIRDVLVPNYGDGALTPADVWNGTAHLDGVRGAEINVERSGNVGDFPWPHLYTWRNNRIVPATAPGASAGDTGWSVADHFSLISGYDARTVKGQRQLTATTLTGRFAADRETLTYRGTRTTYTWRNGAWRPVRTVRTGPLSEAKARDYVGWQGVTWRQ